MKNIKNPSFIITSLHHSSLQCMRNMQSSMSSIKITRVLIPKQQLIFTHEIYMFLPYSIYIYMCIPLYCVT